MFNMWLAKEKESEREEKKWLIILIKLVVNCYIINLQSRGGKEEKKMCIAHPFLFYYEYVMKCLMRWTNR